MADSLERRLVVLEWQLWILIALAVAFCSLLLRIAVKLGAI